MAISSPSLVKSVSHLPTKINVVKFDVMNNFWMWRCEMMDVLTASILEDFLHLEEKPEEISEKDWDKMNRTTCDLIRSCLTQKIRYYVLYETSTRKIWEILEKKYLMKSIEFRMHLKRRFYRFQLKRGLSIGEHMNSPIESPLFNWKR